MSASRQASAIGEPDRLWRRAWGMAMVLSLYAMAGGILSLLGWMLDIRSVTSWDDSGISIQPNAALCVSLSGLALLMLNLKRTRVAGICGALVALIGGATVVEWVTGFDFGIDSLLLFDREWGRVGVIFPGRMGPPGSLSWTIIGSALVLSSEIAGRHRRFVPPLALITLAISLLSIAGYLYGASTLYTMPRLTVIALQTATFIAAVSVGLILSIPDHQPARLLLEDSFAGAVARRLGPVLILLPLGIGGVRLMAQNAGLFDTGFGTTVRTVIEIILLLGLLWWTLSIVSRQQAAKRDSNQRVQAILGSITDAFYTLDSQWRFTFLNENAQQRTGRSDLVGVSIWDAFPSLVGRESSVQLHRAMAERVSTEYELFFEPWQKWLHGKVYPTADGGLAVYSQDITERKRLEEHTRTLGERYRLITDATPALISYIDARRIYRFANRGYEEWFGRKREEIVGKPMVEVLGQAAMEALEPHLTKALSGTRVAFEAQVPYKDGGIRFVHAEYVPDLGPDGSIAGVYVLVADITRQKNVENQLRHNQQTFAHLIEQAPWGIYIVDSSFRIAHVNRGSQEGTFRNVRPLIGRDFSEAIQIVWPQDVATFIIDHFRHTLETGEPFSSKDFIHARGDIDRVEASEWQLHRITLSDGQFGVVCYFFDSTKLREAEQELRLAKEAAERANIAKDNFMATLSHELRTPLTPVLGMLSLWENTAGFPPELQSDLQMIRRNVSLEARLIDDLLDLTRIARGKLALSLEVLDVQKLIESVIAMYGSEAAAKRVNLVVDLQSRACYVRADAGRLQQVFWNILKNAVKFTAGGGQIRIGTRNGADGKIQISIQDNGIGISPEMLARLFRPFEQESVESVKQFGGLGLGLAISKRLIEAQGGQITAHSEGKYRGATFVITLPSVASPADADSTIASSGLNDPDGCESARCLRVLLVEDHPDTAKVLAVLMRRNGHEVTVTHAVADALAAAQTEPFDALVSDLGLPDGSGLDLIRHIRQSLALTLPAIALTGYGMDEDISRCREAGFDEHLTKPINFTKLEETLQRLCSEHAAVESAE